MRIRCYSELITFHTFEERFKYLQLNGIVGDDTFGFDRYLNQVFYRSKEWKTIRDKIIIRDNACDLALPDNEIYGRIIIHHMNPLLVKDIVNKTDLLLDPEYLICVSHNTHNAIHYGDMDLINRYMPIERTRNDTCPWKK